MRPPFETFKGAICKGSYALGSACGNCERCKWERGQMGIAGEGVATNTAAIAPAPAPGRADRIKHLLLAVFPFRSRSSDFMRSIETEIRLLLKGASTGCLRVTLEHGAGDEIGLGSHLMEAAGGAVARGWTRGNNALKLFDPELAEAITREVYDLLLLQKADNNKPQLGCATTLELVNELAARASVSATIGEQWPNYKTVDRS